MDELTNISILEKRTKFNGEYIGCAEITFKDILKLLKYSIFCKIRNIGRKKIVIRAIDDNNKNYIIDFLIQNG